MRSVLVRWRCWFLLLLLLLFFGAGRKGERICVFFRRDGHQRQFIRLVDPPGSGAVGEKDFDALLVEPVVTQHAVHGEEPVDLHLSAPLPIPSAREEDGLVASLEEAAPGLDDVLRTVAPFVVGAERVADQLGRLVPRPELRTRSEPFDVAVAQEALLVLRRRLVVVVDQRQEIDVAPVQRPFVSPAVAGAAAGCPSDHPVGTFVLENLVDAFVAV